ncbi:MAG: hypothetical protein C0428_07280 [Polaromonas sp.]|uniref:CNP1-like family protein n=1 Tax=Polaromonas sp. TaxID=1869339 RepID=UPI004036DC64|nr:hypothetical protein [Polaromonas sp.]
MIFKSLVMTCLLGLSVAAWAQRDAELADWKEEAVPPPPAFDAGKLLTFDVSEASSLSYGVDPATLRLSKDGVLSYVMVASSASGARNVLYEGLRCVTGEVKTYARYSPSGNWNPVTQPEWRSVFGNMPSKHALAFARAGACDNAAQASSVDEIIRKLKFNRFSRFNW